GDCMEEDVDRLARLAGEFGLVEVALFLFPEGRDAKGERALRETARAARGGRDGRPERAFRGIARLSRGAYVPFDEGSARQLRELLTAVAVYATGGRKALQNFSDKTRSGAALRLLEQLG